MWGLIPHALNYFNHISQTVYRQAFRGNLKLNPTLCENAQSVCLQAFWVHVVHFAYDTMRPKRLPAGILNFSTCAIFYTAMPLKRLQAGVLQQHPECGVYFFHEVGLDPKRLPGGVSQN